MTEELSDAEDAARYRWLLTRDPQEWITDATGVNCWGYGDNKALYDAAIDAARHHGSIRSDS